jgi:hypothetical protein
MRVWIGLSWISIGICDLSCEHGNDLDVPCRMVILLIETESYEQFL